MAKIHSLKILNYRCIERFENVFGEASFICLIGRGDSGKTTILNAIYSVMSPHWNMTFSDTDFYNGNLNNPIEIEVSLYDIPIELLTDTKYGLYKRFLTSKNQIFEDITSDESDNYRDILTIKLIVKKDLEPKWYVVNDRSNQDDVEISSSDRSKLNVFMISDYLDRHFTWCKGSPLYTLLKLMNIEVDTEKFIIDANRKAIETVKLIDSLTSFKSVIDKIKSSAAELGLYIKDLEALLDFKDSLVKEGNIALHNEGVPNRLSGKGTRRLLSIAIQLELIKQGGIILIDEIEQGLEPDRSKFLVKKLKDNNQGQIFVTTHSNNILVELNASTIFLKNSESRELYSFNSDFQGCIRNSPEAFFARKIIVCEGATEIGICRALNDYRIKNNQNNFEVLSIALANGTGSNFISYCYHFKKSKYDVCAFCDSDDQAINSKKQELQGMGVTIIDCDTNNSIEQQLFFDLPWEKICMLLRYVAAEKTEQSILAVTEKSSYDELFENDTYKIRKLLGDKAKEKEWFKRTDHGQKLGDIWFNSLESLEEKTLKVQYNKLTHWIDE